MNTDLFIRDFIATHESQKEYSPVEKLAQWIYNHPTIIKTAEVAGLTVGTGSLALASLTFPLGYVTLPLLIEGSLLSSISSLAYYSLEILVPPHHDMEHHIFKSATFGVGRLYYQGDIPILELHSDNPYQAGVSHGYLMGKFLNDLLNRLDLIQLFSHFPKAFQAPDTLQEIYQTLPPEYQKELEGIVDGFHQWQHEAKGSRVLTIHDLILFHLMPDSLHFSPEEYEATLHSDNEREASSERVKRQPLVACTVVIDKDPKKGLTFGRNMDWPSFGIFGAYSLVINRKYPHTHKISTVEIGFPGFAGTLTGMNANGLSLAMNVCSGETSTIRGMPAAFYNRSCLENCRLVRDVEKKIKSDDPLGTFHLTVADSHKGETIHFYQDEDQEGHLIREWEKGNPLITTNCRYTLKDETYDHMHSSEEREEILQSFFHEAKMIPQSQMDISKLVKGCLGIRPEVNTWITTQKVIMYPQTRTMEVAFDNAFAGQAVLRELDLERLFS